MEGESNLAIEQPIAGVVEISTTTDSIGNVAVANQLGEGSINVEVSGEEKKAAEDSHEADDPNVLMDFSALFKNKHARKPQLSNGFKKKVVQKKVEEIPSSSVTTDKENVAVEGGDTASSSTIEATNSASTISITPTVVLKNEIPKNLTITQEEMRQRKFLDQRRWFCLSRPQYQRSCGISSLMSCWNYLYSWLGVGTLPPISVEEALQILGVEKEGKLFADTDFGNFTGNGTLIKWFKLLCKYFKVDGTAFIFWKMCGDNRTAGVDANEALAQLEQGLRGETMTFIYHANDHYFCPMGYEIVPRRPPDAYKKLEEIDPNEVDHWIFIGEPSKRFPAFHIKPWEEIAKDISLGNPFYYDIRRPEKGVMERQGEAYRTTKQGTSIHCIMAFQKIIKKIKVKGTQNSSVVNIPATISNLEVEETNQHTKTYSQNEVENEVVVNNEIDLEKVKENRGESAEEILNTEKDKSLLLEKSEIQKVKNELQEQINGEENEKAW